MTDETRRWLGLWKETCQHLNRLSLTHSERTTVRQTLWDSWRAARRQGRDTSHNVTARGRFRLERDRMLRFVRQGGIGVYTPQETHQKDGMQTTITTEVSPAPAPNTKAFKDFAVGEWLLSESTGAFGIKVGKRIRFYHTQGCSTNHECSVDVPSDKLYLVPTRVDIKVTR